MIKGGIDVFLGQINNYLVPTGMANTVIPIKTISNTNEKESIYILINI